MQGITRLTHSKWRYVIAVLLGFILALTFDARHDIALTWLPTITALSVLAIFSGLLVRLSPKSALVFGYCFGLGLFGYGLNWIYISMDAFGGAPLYFAVFANACVILYLSLYYALGSFLVVKLAKSINHRLCLIAPVFAGLEWVRSVFFIGFPWLSLGYTTIETPLAYLSRVGGVFFVSFLLLMTVTLCQLQIRNNLKTIAIGIYLMTVLVAIALVSRPPASSVIGQPAPTPITAALIQGNMDVITKFDPETMDQSLIQYDRLTQAALEKHADAIDLVVWPETAIPYFYEQVPYVRERIQLMQTDYQFDFISGVPHTTDEFITIYNAIFAQTAKQIPAPTQTLAPTQAPAQSIADTNQFYYKSHLLAFGEYLPMRGFFDFFRDYVTIPMSDFSRGETVQPAFTVAGIELAPSICFEAVFGDKIRQNARQAQALVNLSNDGWFGRSKAQPQHLNIARMRAIENQKPMLRATNNGISAIIDADGQITQTTPAFDSGMVVGEFTPSHAVTPYSRFGDRLGLVLYSLMIIGIMHCVTRAMRN
ncbi:apolipoprotein N-acyltransferase [Ostreibacterium oceani]|uniref:Apolipoprotein N-acyltransferase n=1 Tax=Ostreibacterium oceani TaxID=2654998 RepID=A0A6N7EXL1_9GAMM|nr:apolipoprotein N-acyltransferase [Ostreibacterium oceani]MPV85208.1 apolipoprotein N-acyltransferase [Ostreibacterium oceani]